VSDSAVEHTSGPETSDLWTLFHRLNNHLGVILAHAELLEAKASDDTHRARAGHVVGAALQALSVTRDLRARTIC
jgi:hypothetical protein